MGTVTTSVETAAQVDVHANKPATANKISVGILKLRMCIPRIKLSDI